MHSARWQCNLKVHRLWELLQNFARGVYCVKYFTKSDKILEGVRRVPHKF